MSNKSKKGKREDTPAYKVAEALVKSGGLKSLADVQTSMDELYSNMMQILLNEEMNKHIGYEKNNHSKKGNDNRRNGHSSKAKKV